MSVGPVWSTDPKGSRILHFDNYKGWLVYIFERRSEDPQIVVVELFRQ